MKLIDIHTHILPKIDDGSQSLEESIKLIQNSVEQGCTDIFLTPHSDCVLEKGMMYTEEKIVRLKKEINHLKIPVHLYKGNEIYIKEKNIENIINALKYKELYSMNYTRFVLVEFSPYLNKIEEILYCLSLLLVNNWYPIIAHTERLNPQIATIDNVIKFKKLGCKIQINYYSLVEESDIKIKRLARVLIHNELVDFCGSDTHSLYHRPPAIKEGVEYIKNHCRQSYANKILWENAEQYLMI